jgi:hypothetical protein
MFRPPNRGGLLAFSINPKIPHGSRDGKEMDGTMAAKPGGLNVVV